MRFSDWWSFPVIAGACALMSLGCRHENPTNAQAKPPPAAGAGVRVERSDRSSITTVEAEPPGGPRESVVRPDLAPLEGPGEASAQAESAKSPSIVEHTSAENDPARSISPKPIVAKSARPQRTMKRDARAKSAAPAMAVANLRPQKDKTLEGMATVLESSDGGRMAVSVKLGLPGQYSVLLLDPGRSCVEKRSERAPEVRTRVGTAESEGATPKASDRGYTQIGTITVRASGTGHAELAIPESAMKGGVSALSGRPLVIYEGRPDSQGLIEALAGNKAAACGTIEVAMEEEPVG